MGLLPEAMQRVEQLTSDYPERIAKVEENDIRLGLALTRLGSQEQKMQACMDRCERMPMAEQVRMMCRDELWKRLEETKIESLGRTVDLQARAIEEIGERLQEVCYVVCYGGAPPNQELHLRADLQAKELVTPAEG